MRVLISGASGCIGRAVAARLLAGGHEVTGCALEPPPPGWEPARWIRGDLADLDIGPMVRGHDAVVHLAALVHRPDVQDIDAYRRANVDLTERFAAAAQDAGVGKLVYASTVAVYGKDSDLHADEATAVAPQTPYAVTKLASEAPILAAGGFVLRLPVAYGPGDRGNVAKLIDAVRRGRFVLPSRTLNKRSFVAAANVAAAAEACLTSPEPGDVFLVTDDADLSLRELVGHISASLGKRPPVTVPRSLLQAVATAGSLMERVGVRAPLTRSQLRKLTGSLTFTCDKARRRLGYAPALTPAEAIDAAVRATQEAR